METRTVPSSIKLSQLARALSFLSVLNRTDRNSEKQTSRAAELKKATATAYVLLLWSYCLLSLPSEKLSDQKPSK
uniref:Uncharacterized protein n=1 Tax=Setaria italica TaxID=4555 RepID=K3ZBF6_SETIT